MSVRLLCLCLLLVLLCPGWAEEQTCLTSASKCDECIQSGPTCAWCTDPNIHIHCIPSNWLQKAGCLKRYTYNPQGGVQVVKNDSSSTEPANSTALHLQPQELSLRLRPGVSQSFPLTITMPTDQPIELTMDTSPVPTGVNVTFSSIMNGNPLVIQVNVEAAKCPSDDSNHNRTGPWLVHITPRGFSLDVKLEISLECQCECTKKREENSSSCSGHGALECGQCECYEPYEGKQCQEDSDSFTSYSEDFCRWGPTAPLCSGRGKCMKGYCVCDRRLDPQERYSGTYCECSNFDCPYHNGSICGGHGWCRCGQCICEDNWAGEDCSCTLDPTPSCMTTDQLVCNNRGICQCGTCKCESIYRGPTCEECPQCSDTCSRFWPCVQCWAFDTGEMKNRCDQECHNLNVTVVETVHNLPDYEEDRGFCRMRGPDDDYCRVDYSYIWTPSGYKATVVRARKCY